MGGSGNPANPIDGWRAEHAWFSRLLELVRGQLDLVHAGERPDYELMLDVVAYLREYSDRFHHPREDVAFERLAERCPEMDLVLARLRQEHRVIAHAGETLREHLEAILAGAIVPRGEVEVAVAMCLVYYGNHIAKEEEDILPRAAQALTPQDWEAVGAGAPAAPAASELALAGRLEERCRALLGEAATGAGRGR